MRWVGLGKLTGVGVGFVTYRLSMNSLLRRHPSIRWAAPVAVVAAVGLSQTVGGAADAAPNLPTRTPAQLVASAMTSQVKGFSGTVTTSAHLGLPALPSSLGGSGVAGVPLQLLSGDHTIKVWYADRAGARAALLGDRAETDVIVNPSNLWVWNSSDKSVVHQAIPAMPKPGSHSAKSSSRKPDFTPQQVASWALKQIGPSTAVSSSTNLRIAGRSAYDLVLTPKTAATKVGSIHIAIDSATSMPLRTQVFARGSSSPALSVGFSSLSYAVPSASTFTFSAPKGAMVTENPAGSIAKSASGAASAAPAKKTATASPASASSAASQASSATSAASRDHGRVVGSDWASVWVGPVPSQAAAAGSGSSGSSSDSGNTVRGALELLPKVSGQWGSGRLLDTALFSAVLTDDGRLAIGAVQPSSLYSALARR